MTKEEATTAYNAIREYYYEHVIPAMASIAKTINSMPRILHRAIVKVQLHDPYLRAYVRRPARHRRLKR